LTKILIVSGSPVVSSSTDLLLYELAAAIEASLPEGSCELTFVKLTNLRFIPCQACGKDPTPDWCLFHDDLDPVYSQLAACDCLLFGTPVYFDSVSAQAKAFMDRCNCFRPPDYSRTQTEHHFIKRLTRKRPGAMVLVGGPDQWIEGARRSIAGFFKWIEVTNEGLVAYTSADDYRIGTVKDDPATLMRARELGKLLAARLEDAHEG
jgi:multimeric flavodoxin WrbA